MQQIERNPIYELVDEYYDHPVLQKVRNVNGMSMYVVRLPCLLLNEKRYLIALTFQDDYIPIGSSIPLAHLRWRSFMIRVLQEEDFERLPVHSYTIKQVDKFMLPLSIVKRSKEISIYEVDTLQDLQLSLLHTRGQEFEYPSTGNLVSAFETFQTLLNWKD